MESKPLNIHASGLLLKGYFICLPPVMGFVLTITSLCPLKVGCGVSHVWRADCEEQNITVILAAKERRKEGKTKKRPMGWPAKQGP